MECGQRTKMIGNVECLCDLPICDLVSVFTTLAHPVAIIPEEPRPLLSNLSLSTDVQPIRSELSPSPSAQAEPEKSAAVVILQGSAGHWRFAWAAACRLPGV